MIFKVDHTCKNGKHTIIWFQQMAHLVLREQRTHEAYEPTSTTVDWKTGVATDLTIFFIEVKILKHMYSEQHDTNCNKHVQLLYMKDLPIACEGYITLLEEKNLLIQTKQQANFFFLTFMHSKLHLAKKKTFKAATQL